MAAHVIQQVRDAIVAQLAAYGSGLSAANVLLWKSYGQDATVAPFVFVKTLDDTSERKSVGFPALEELTAQFQITVVVYQDNDYEAAALDLRTLVEKALLGTIAAMTLGGRVALLTRIGAHVEEDTAVGAKPTYAIHLTFEAWIRHLESQPDVLQ